MTETPYQETTFTACDHTTIFTSAGVVLIGYPNGWGTRFEPKAAIAHAQHILEHYAELEQLQQALEARWRDIAGEVKKRFEAENEDRLPFSAATAQDIERLLENAAGVNQRGYFTEKPTSPSGQWYRSLWNEEGTDTTTFEQEWTPFLRICHELQTQE